MFPKMKIIVEISKNKAKPFSIKKNTPFQDLLIKNFLQLSSRPLLQKMVVFKSFKNIFILYKIILSSLPTFLNKLYSIYKREIIMSLIFNYFSESNFIPKYAKHLLICLLLSFKITGY